MKFRTKKNHLPESILSKSIQKRHLLGKGWSNSCRNARENLVTTFFEQIAGQFSLSERDTTVVIRVTNWHISAELYFLAIKGETKKKRKVFSGTWKVYKLGGVRIGNVTNWVWSGKYRTWRKSSREFLNILNRNLQQFTLNSEFETCLVNP